MKKFWLVLQREYITRIRKKSFIIITFLGPILMIGFYLLPAYFSVKAEKHKTYKVIYINNIHDLQLTSDKKVKFFDLYSTLGNSYTFDKIKQLAIKGDTTITKFDGLLVINSLDTINFYVLSDKSVSVSDVVKSKLQNIIQAYRLKKLGINPQQLAQVFQAINFQNFKLTAKGEQKNLSWLKAALGMAGALLAYMFVFMYGGMALRSVMEEKVNRVIELIVSSVKPFQLMFGKLTAILLVALTQFVIWLVSVLILFKLSVIFVSSAAPPKAIEQINIVLANLKNLNLWLWVIIFLFYFFTGYLLYGALFAAIGSAVDVETDAQQFVWPLTLPMLIAVFSLEPLMLNPDGAYAFWLSIIPFTSPVVMMLRISYGIPQVVPIWQLILSMVLMLITVWLSIWAAGKIFRFGILFYGKRPTYRDFIKWIKA